MARRKFSEFTKGATPAGTFVFPCLSTPNTKFNPEGEYMVSLDLEGQAAEDFKKIIDEAFELEYAHECGEKGKELMKYNGHPYGPATDRDKQEIPGVTRFKFKRKAGGVYSDRHPKAGQRWTQTIPIWGAKSTTPVTAPVWGGTVGRISYTIVPWFTNALGFGIRLQIEAVKIISLVTAGEKAPEAYGFEDEDGYEPPVETPPATVGEQNGMASEESGGTVDF
jgi:hypothetical protein